MAALAVTSAYLAVLSPDCTSVTPADTTVLWLEYEVSPRLTCWCTWCPGGDAGKTGEPLGGRALLNGGNGSARAGFEILYPYHFLVTFWFLTMNEMSPAASHSYLP